MGTARATIDERPILGNRTVEWVLSGGVRPVIRTFDVSPKDADALVGGPPVPVTLRIEDGDRSVAVHRLYVLSRAAGDNEHVARIRVADRRWLWSRIHVARNYNIRRHNGFKRTGPPDVDLLVPVTPNVWYAAYSLPGGDSESPPWNVHDILQDVFSRIGEIDNGPFVISHEIAGKLISYPVENLEIDDAGDMALQRVLAYLPEAEVTIDSNGDARIFARNSGAENRLIADAGPEMVGKGHIEFVSLARTRPREVNVYFSTEVEVRLDFLEPGNPAVSEAGSAVGDFAVDNVLPVPDFTLSVGGEDLPIGTWISFNDAINAWGTPPGIKTLDYNILRRAFIPYVDLWAAMRLAGARTVDSDWASRVAAMQRHWRQTFRISRNLWDRIHQVKAYRVATIDPEHGTRSPALVFCKYFVLGSMRSWYQDAQGQGDLSFGFNVDAYPDGGKIGPGVRHAPALLSVLDEDQGILHLDFVADKTRVFEMFIPGEMDHIPKGVLGQWGMPVSFDSINGGTRLPEMKAGHKCAMIVTVMPAAPNDESRFYKITVKPEAVAGLLPPAASRWINDSSGPPIDVRIGPGVETARLAWYDEKQNSIARFLGVQKGPFDIKGLVINASREPIIASGATISGASLDNIALAAAARVYAQHADRPMGAKSVRIDSGAQLVGWLSGATHGITPEGVVYTAYDVMDEVIPLNILSLMSASSRAMILRLAQPGKL